MDLNRTWTDIANGGLWVNIKSGMAFNPAGSVRAHVHLASILIKENRPAEAAQELEIYLGAVPNPFDSDRLRALLAQLRAAARR